MNWQHCCLYLTLPVRQKKRNFPCCQSLNVSTNMLYNTGSQEALQTQTNYMKLYMQWWKCILYEMQNREKARWRFREAQNSFLLLFWICLNIHTILKQPLYTILMHPMFLLSKHWKQSLYSSSLYYISVEQRILNKSNEIQTEVLLLPRLTQKG